MLSAIAGLALAWCSSAGYLPAWAANAPDLPRAGRGRGGVGRRPGALVGPLRSRPRVVRAPADRHGVVGGRPGRRDPAPDRGGDGRRMGGGGPGRACRPRGPSCRAAPKGEFRVIWLGADTETSFAAPGGDPVGVVPNGASSLRFGLTGREGIVATDTGRTLTGSGEGYLHEALAEIVSGATTHGGALLAPLGVRFVVAQEGDLPRRRSKACSTRRSISTGRARRGSSSTGTPRGSRPPPCSPPTKRSARSSHRRIWARSNSCRRSACPLLAAVEGWAGEAPAPGTVVVSTEFDPDWRLEAPNGESSDLARAFGWSTAFDAPAGVGPRPIHGAMGAHRGDDRAGAAVVGGPVDHAEAGVAMRSERHVTPATRGRGQGLLALAVLVVVVGGGFALQRGVGPRARRGGAGRDVQLGRVVLPPRRGSEGVEGHVVPREPRRRRRSPSGSRRSRPRKPAERRGPSPCRRRPPSPCRCRPRDGRRRRSSSTSTDGSRRRGSRRAAGERSASARSRARRRPAPTWFAPDGTTEQGEDAYLVVMNPFAVDAVFDVVLFTPKRAPIRNSALTDHVLRPGKSVAFRLNAFAEGEAAVGAEVDVSFGRVAVSSAGDHARRRHPQRDRQRRRPVRRRYLPVGGGAGQSTSTSWSPARIRSTSARHCCPVESPVPAGGSDRGESEPDVGSSRIP